MSRPARRAPTIVASLGKDAKGPVLVIEGLSGNITGQKRAQGFADELKKSRPGSRSSPRCRATGTAGKAANITNDILTRTPDLVAIFCRQ